MVNPLANASRREFRTYANPPVHEVILDLQFLQELDDTPVRDLAPRIKDTLGFTDATEITGSEILMSVGLSQQEHRVRRRYEGWSFRSSPPGWMLNAQKRQLTFHVVRPGKWPSGRYVGWHEIKNRYAAIHEALQDVYGGLDIKRAGLRYLNRIAMPNGGDTDEWFTLRFEHPPFLDGLYAFDNKQTWARAGFGEDVGVTIRLARIRIEEEDLAKSHIGILLDIDVFNLLIKDAPAYDDIPEWYDRAHAAENAVFEASVTDLARESFDNDRS